MTTTNDLNSATEIRNPYAFMQRILILMLLIIPAAVSSQAPQDLKPFNCTHCAAWSEPEAPWQLAENTWFVGPKGLSSVLIVDAGEMALIDGTLPQSVEQILANMEALGFNSQKLKWILNSHAHYDHAGGIAALERITGATVVAGDRGVFALTEGPYHPDDPQAGYGEAARFPSVKKVHAVKNGDTIMIGNTKITAVASPGHAPGGMSWTWQACNDKSGCLDVVYLDSLNAVSADDYRFTDNPETLAELEASINRIALLPCDVAIAAHPDGTPEAQADTTICSAYAEMARQRLARRLENETE